MVALVVETISFEYDDVFSQRIFDEYATFFHFKE
jgi:hypothetical protein